MSKLRPMRVTATLEAGLAHANDWGIALDGILAGLLHAEAKAELLASGGWHTPLRDQVDPLDLELPLARCTHGDDWHWAATCSWPVDGQGLPTQIVRWSTRHDHRVTTSLTRALPQHVEHERGRYRAHWMPLTVTPGSVSFEAVGDVDHVRALLEPVAAIGKKRAAGHGRVLSWSISATDRDPWEASHLHPDGTLGRPTPRGCLEAAPAPTELQDPPRSGSAGIRPPYSHPSRSRDLLLPTSLHSG